MNYIIDQNTLTELNKDKGKYIVRFIITFFLSGSLVALLFIFQKPSLSVLTAIGVALVLTIAFGYVLFLISEYIIPEKNYKKIIKNSYQSSHITNDVVISSIKEKSQHYLGIEITVVVAKEIDEDKELYVYILRENVNPLEVGKSYKFETYHSFLIGYMEK